MVVFLGLSFTLVALFVMNLLTARRENVVPVALVEGFEAHLDEKRYQEAYEKAIDATAAEHAPWFVVPADDKKNMRLITGGRSILLQVSLMALIAARSQSICFGTRFT